jgi:hypothetical protein
LVKEAKDTVTNLQDSTNRAYADVITAIHPTATRLQQRHQTSIAPRMKMKSALTKLALCVDAHRDVSSAASTVRLKAKEWCAYAVSWEQRHANNPTSDTAQAVAEATQQAQLVEDRMAANVKTEQIAETELALAHLKLARLLSDFVSGLAE